MSYGNGISVRQINRGDLKPLGLFPDAGIGVHLSDGGGNGRILRVALADKRGRSLHGGWALNRLHFGAKRLKDGWGNPIDLHDELHGNFLDCTTFFLGKL